MSTVEKSVAQQMAEERLSSQAQSTRAARAALRAVEGRAFAVAGWVDGDGPAHTAWAALHALASGEDGVVVDGDIVVSAEGVDPITVRS